LELLASEQLAVTGEYVNRYVTREDLEALRLALTQVDASYLLPLIRQETTLGLRYRRKDSPVAEGTFSPLNVDSQSDIFTPNLRRSLYPYGEAIADIDEIVQCRRVLALTALEPCARRFSLLLCAQSAARQD
jgi:hypothetical protein